MGISAGGQFPGEQFHDDDNRVLLLRLLTKDAQGEGVAVCSLLPMSGS